jgi:hypothetical protein
MEGKMIRLMTVIVALLAILVGLNNRLVSSALQDGATKSKTMVVTSGQENRKPERQRTHSRLYKPYGGGKKLSDIKVNTQDGVVEVRKGYDDPMLIDYTDESTGLSSLSSRPNAFLEDIASDSDAIVIGTVVDSSSQLTETEDFIFTDHRFKVETVLKHNKSSYLQPSNEIVVTRSGGTIEDNGRVLRGVDVYFEPFNENAKYLLFLRYVPLSDGYQAFRVGSFKIKGSAVISLAKSSLPPDVGADGLKTFLERVRSAVESESLIKQKQRFYKLY